MAGIKEIKELIAGMEVATIAIKKVMKDGKVDLSDSSVVIELGMQFPVIMAAIEGIGQIPAEAKDIDAQEAIEIVQALYAGVKKVQEA